MLRFSRFILCAFVLIIFLYKRVYTYSINQNDNEPQINSLYENTDSTDPYSLKHLIHLLNSNCDINGLQESWMKTSQGREKRSIADIDIPNSGGSADATNELLAEQIFNTPVSQINMEKLQESPYMKYLLIRSNESLIHILHQEKRNREFHPRLGKRDPGLCSEMQLARPQLYAPRLGKKNMHFTPRLGRQMCSENMEKPN